MDESRLRLYDKCALITCPLHSNSQISFIKLKDQQQTYCGRYCKVDSSHIQIQLLDVLLSRYEENGLREQKRKLLNQIKEQKVLLDQLLATIEQQRNKYFSRLNALAARIETYQSTPLKVIEFVNSKQWLTPEDMRYVIQNMEKSLIRNGVEWKLKSENWEKFSLIITAPPKQNPSPQFSNSFQHSIDTLLLKYKRDLESVVVAARQRQENYSYNSIVPTLIDSFSLFIYTLGHKQLALKQALYLSAKKSFNLPQASIKDVFEHVKSKLQCLEICDQAFGAVSLQISNDEIKALDSFSQSYKSQVQLANIMVQVYRSFNQRKQKKNEAVRYLQKAFGLLSQESIPYYQAQADSVKSLLPFIVFQLFIQLLSDQIQAPIDEEITLIVSYFVHNRLWLDTKIGNTLYCQLIEILSEINHQNNQSNKINLEFLKQKIENFQLSQLLLTDPNGWKEICKQSNIQLEYSDPQDNAQNLLQQVWEQREQFQREFRVCIQACQKMKELSQIISVDELYGMFF